MKPELALALDPLGRLQVIFKAAKVVCDPTAPLNMFYRTLNDMYMTAKFYLTENNFEYALLFYLRVATEELPKRKDYRGFWCLEKVQAEACLNDACNKIAELREELLRQYNCDAVKVRASYELGVYGSEYSSVLPNQHANKSFKVKSVGNASDSVVSNQTAEEIPHPHSNLLLVEDPLVAPVSNKAERKSSADFVNFVTVESVSGSVDPKSAYNVPAHQFDKNLLESSSQELCEVVVAGKILEKFAEKAESNTLLNIETCAVLCGRMASGTTFQITHAVIPKQVGSSDTCDMQNEEEILAFQETHNLITLGWIHTHPTQTAFLSSVDLHTHCAYQLLLPEAIAIVLAPKFNQVGVFRLTAKGMGEIGCCLQDGFHLHNDAKLLFGQCTNFHFDDELKAKIVDLRQL